MSSFSSKIAVALCFTSFTAAARAQCAEWSGAFGIDGANSSVNTLAVHDLGRGPELVAGGLFSIAGSTSASHIASWDGAAWSSFGSGFGGTIPCCDPREVLCSLTFDDGSGLALYVGGRFLTAGGVSATHIAKWNGASWSPVGAGFDGAVKALAVFDDGSGPALYAGGGFRESGGVPMNSLARWDGAQWLALGAGVATDGHTDVRALAAFDDGSGAALYFAGQVPNYNGVVLGHLGRWDGASVTRPGNGFDDPVNALALHDDGAGLALYAGGKFENNGATSVRRVAKWDGGAWSALAFAGTNGVNGIVRALASFDDGSGPALFVAGGFNDASGVSAGRVAKWDGASWSALGSGVTWAHNAAGSALALAVHDDGSGAALYVGGAFNVAGGAAVNNLARWDGANWTRVGGGFGVNAVGEMTLLAADVGGGEQLFAGGSFASIGGTLAPGVARFDGANWHAMPVAASDTVFGNADAFITFDDGTGTALYASGFYTLPGNTYMRSVARWTGADWIALGTGMDGDGLALAVFDDGNGPALHVGGVFTTIDGVSAAHVAKWDGTSWSALGSGVNQLVRDLAVFDDGSGPALYVAGNFTTAGGIAADGFARWDGATWSAPGAGVVNGASSLELFDDGTGEALHVLTTTGAGINTARALAKWDGASMTLVGGGLTPFGSSAMSGMFVFDDGGGEALYVAAHFNFADGLLTNGIAKWDGAAWSALDGGLTSVFVNAYDSPHALAAYDENGDGVRDLFAGGYFTHADGRVSNGIGAWRGCAPPLGTPYCFGDGSGTACPCGNASAIGAEQGCVHSAGFGAQLGASGSTSVIADDQTFIASSMPANKPCVLFVGTLPMAGGAGVLFGDGLRCAGPSVHRLGVRTGDANGVASWGPGFSALGYWQGGDTRFFQVWFRDPSGPCGNATNMTSALSVVFTN